MTNAVSIHIGVDTPRCMPGRPLRQSETLTWQMACLAQQAGYRSVQMLRGSAATRRSVHRALTSAAGTLDTGDTLLVTFTGHGRAVRDADGDDYGSDETWCLYDGEVADDQLVGYWRLFQPGVRIVVVADGCHVGGSDRGEDEPGAARDRDAVPQSAGAGDAASGGPSNGASAGVAAPDARPCIDAPPSTTDGIRASVLFLASARENQEAQEGLFTRHLLDLWNEGAFPGSFCELHQEVRDRVVAERGSRQVPQIQMLGSFDRDLLGERAFHLAHRGRSGR